MDLSGCNDHLAPRIPPWTGASSRDGAVLVLSHHGALDAAGSEQAIERAESFSRDAGDATSVRKRLVNLLVEALGNLVRHVDEEGRPSVKVEVWQEQDHYRMLFCNDVPVTTAALLVHRIELLNEMDEEALKAHYTMLLANEGRTERGGAGLGLVTMARRSARPMHATACTRAEGRAYLCLELALERQT